MNHAPDPSVLTAIDHSLLRATRVWKGQVDPGFWEFFNPDRRAGLRLGWQEEVAGDRTAARASLRAEHLAQARPDLSRVHVSWWVRALQDEPLSVQCAVASSLPTSVAEALRDGLGLTVDDLSSARRAHPRVLDVVMALWTERIVGDLPDRDDDPPAIAALSRFDVPTTVLLIRATGLAKWAMTPHPMPRLDAREHERFEFFRGTLGDLDRRYLHIVETDIAALDPEEPHAEARAGLVAFARLLKPVDPHRVRWALQHLPYATAKTIRTLMASTSRKMPMLLQWESDMLFLAWKRLFEEGRISVGWGVRT